jgi:hypothetical protein
MGVTDRDLLVFGCGVSLIALGGAYVYLRTRFLESVPRRASEKVRDGRARQMRVATTEQPGD